MFRHAVRAHAARGGYTACMVRAVLTASGDVHLPEAMREQLRLRPGDQVELRLVGDHSVVIETRVVSAMSLAGILKTERSISLEDMERGIEEGAIGR
jgi:antitoxin component of MazEF toxin-antitoxin module